MTEKHLQFLDYLLPIMSKSNDGVFIDSIANKYKKEYNIIFDLAEIDHFESLYEYKYFTFPYNFNRTAKIIPEIKEIIDTHGSLSKYLIRCLESKEREQAEIDIKNKLETDLAKSNIEANILNAKIAAQNLKDKNATRMTTWLNIIIGILNLGLLAFQILKAV